MDGGGVLVLETWSLSSPLSGVIPVPGHPSKPVNGGSPEPGLYHTQFSILGYNPAAPNSLPLIGATVAWAPVGGDEDPPVTLALGPESNVRSQNWWGLTVWDVTGFRFHAADVWPDRLLDLTGLAAPLARETRPLSPGPYLQPYGYGPYLQPYGPYIDDVHGVHAPGDFDQIKAYARLQAVAAARSSFVRVIAEDQLGGTGNKDVRWWLLFRLPFRVPLIGDADGVLPLDQGGLIDARLAAAFTTPAGVNFVEIGDPPTSPEATDVAELRLGAGARHPYFAGSMMGAQSDTSPEHLSNPLESFAIDAPTLTTLSGLKWFSEQPGADQNMQAQSRLFKVATLADGVWWSKNRVQDSSVNATDNRGAYLDNQAEATLSFANLPALLDGALAKDQMPSAGPTGHDDPFTPPNQPTLTALTSTTPYGKDRPPPFAPSMPLLAQFGLIAMADAPANAVSAGNPYAANPPYQYLHTRMADARVPVAAAAANPPRVFEWRRWVRIEDSAEPAAGAAVLVRVRQGAYRPGAKPGEPTHDLHPESLDAVYTVRVEGLRDSHVLDIWSANVAGAAHAAARDALGAAAPCLMPTLRAAPSAVNGRWVLELQCRESFPGDATDGAAFQLGPSACQPPLPLGFVVSGRIFKAATAPHAQAGGVAKGGSTATCRCPLRRATPIPPPPRPC